MSDEKYNAGMKTRRLVLGDAHVERSLKNATSFDRDFQRMITEMAWGTAWQGESLEIHQRHMIVIAILAALGREHELELHMRATQNTGVTPQEMKDVLQTVAIYAGVPAANSAFSLAKKIYSELGINLNWEEDDE
jgi:4-carboxymuconolactone decarboxylase